MTEKPFRFENFEYIPTSTIFSKIHSDGNSFDNTFKGYVRVHKNDAKELVDLLNKQQKIIKQQGDYWRKLESEVIELGVKNKELEHRIRELEHDNEQLFEAKEHWHKIAKSRKTSEHDV